MIKRHMKIILIFLLMIGAIIATIITCIVFHPTYKKGSFWYTLTPSMIMQGVKSSTDTFPIEDVTLDLYYGLYCLDYDEPESYHRSSEEETVFFGIYAGGKGEELSISCDMDIEDYTAINNHILIKELSSEEAFTEEYGYTMDYLGIDYNHHEQIAIPSDVFTEDSGKFYIKICSFNPTGETKTSVKSALVSVLEIRYEKLDEETIKIIFDR